MDIALSDKTIKEVEAAGKSVMNDHFGPDEPHSFAAEDTDGHAKVGLAGLYLGTDYPEIESRNAIGDALANLMHLCDKEDLSFHYVLEKARSHYRAEVKAEQETAKEKNRL
jgi:hypothetical protein